MADRFDPVFKICLGLGALLVGLAVRVFRLEPDGWLIPGKAKDVRGPFFAQVDPPAADWDFSALHPKDEGARLFDHAEKWAGQLASFAHFRKIHHRGGIGGTISAWRLPMPLEKSSSKAATKRNFEEFGRGKTYARTKRKFGKKRADRQRIAVVLSNKRKATSRKRKTKRSR